MELKLEKIILTKADKTPFQGGCVQILSAKKITCNLSSFLKFCSLYFDLETIDRNVITVLSLP
jgi:hypothetical protein